MKGMKGIAPLVIIALVVVIGAAGAGLYITGRVPFAVSTTDTFVCEQADVDTMLVMDVSGSMRDNCGADRQASPGEQPCKIVSAINAAKSLSSSLVNGRVADKAGVVSFSTQTRTVYSLSRDVPIINAQLDSMVTQPNNGGNTCIECGLLDAKNSMFSSSTNPKKAIVLLTDGYPNSCASGNSGSQATSCSRITAQDRALAQASDILGRGGVLYVIGYDIKDEYTDGGNLIVSATEIKNFLLQLASNGGGKYYDARETDVSDIYRAIGDILLCQLCDNDGIQDAGENCANCPHDVPTPAGQLCCTGVTRAAACGSDSQCSDGKSCTTDFCNAPGQCTATCTNPVQQGWFLDSTGMCTQSCSDGTAPGTCSAVSANKGMLCSSQAGSSSLVPDCARCGCPAGRICDAATNTCQVVCSDGTKLNTCSVSKPGYCSSTGNLQLRCDLCGCAPGLDCATATGICTSPPTLTNVVQPTYPYDTEFTVIVSAAGLPFNHPVRGRVSDENNNLIQESLGRWISASQIELLFAPIRTPGNYRFQSFSTKPYPPNDQIFSGVGSFQIKAPLTVEFTITDVVQYTVRDMELTLRVVTPSGQVVPTINTFSAVVDGVTTKQLSPTPTDLGSGRIKYVVRKADMIPGTWDITAQVSDPSNKYEPVTKKISGISVTRPQVSVTLQAPSTTQAGSIEKISITTRGVLAEPLDVDLLDLEIVLPNGNTRLHYAKSQFGSVSTGSYDLNYKFEFAGPYKLHVTATEPDYFTGSNPGSDPVVQVGSTGGSGPPPVTCDLTPNVCDANCPLDKDCEQEFPVSSVLIAIVGLAFAGIIGYALFGRKKGRT